MRHTPPRNSDGATSTTDWRWDHRVRPEVLDSATEALSTLDLVTPRPHIWSLEDRLERPWSTVFRLRLQGGHGGDGVIVYYKVPIPRNGRGGGYRDSPDPREEALDRLQPLTLQLKNALGDGPVQAAPVLAVDPEYRSIVTLGMPGEQMKSLYRLREAGQILEWSMRQIGSACRTIEEVGGAAPPPATTIPLLSERAMRRYGSLFARLDDGDAAMRSLVEEVTAHSRSVVYCHGDMSVGNVLFSPSRLAVVDFGWLPKPVGFDLAKLVLRTFANQGPRATTKEALIRNLVEGYANPALSNDPAWRLSRVLTMARFLTRRKVHTGATRVRIYRQFTEIMNGKDPLLEKIA